MEFYIWLLFVFLMSAFGSLTILMIKNNFLIKNISLFSGVAAGVMLATTIWSLLMPSLEYSSSIIEVTFSFSFGFLLLLIIEKLQKRSKNEAFDNETYLAITLHNIPEGLIIGVGFGIANASGNPFGAISLAIAIGIQNFPESMSLSILLKDKNKTNMEIVTLSLISAVVEPIFGIIGYYLSYYIMNALGVILGFTAGMMLFVLLSEMIMNAINENKLIGMLGILVGFILMMILEKKL